MFDFLLAGIITTAVGATASIAGGVAKGVGSYLDAKKESEEEEDDDDEEED